MGVSLNNTTPSNTYPSLIKVGDNFAITSTLKPLSDGDGNDLPMEVSTSGVNFTGTLTQNGQPITTTPSGGAGAIQFSDGSAFASDSNLFWDNTNKRLGVGTSSPIQTLHLASGTARLRDLLFGQAGADAINNTSLVTLKWNGGTGIAVSHSGGISAASTFHVKGSGSTSATTALLVQNSAGTAAVTVRDDLRVIVPQIFETGEANGFIFNSNTITPKINGFLALDRNSNREFRISDTNFTRDYLILQSSSASNFADITFNTNHLAIKKEGNVGFGTATPNVSAILDVTSTTKGFLPPRMTTTQKNAISSPASGLVVYDTTTNKLCCYNGTSWNDLF